MGFARNRAGEQVGFGLQGLRCRIFCWILHTIEPLSRDGVQCRGSVVQGLVLRVCGQGWYVLRFTVQILKALNRAEEQVELGVQRVCRVVNEFFAQARFEM